MFLPEEMGPQQEMGCWPIGLFPRMPPCVGVAVPAVPEAAAPAAAVVEAAAPPVPPPWAFCRFRRQNPAIPDVTIMGMGRPMDPRARRNRPPTGDGEPAGFGALSMKAWRNAAPKRPPIPGWPIQAAAAAAAMPKPPSGPAPGHKRPAVGEAAAPAAAMPKPPRGPPPGRKRPAVGEDAADPPPKRARPTPPSGPLAYRLRRIANDDPPEGVTVEEEYAAVWKEIEMRWGRRQELLQKALDFIIEADAAFADCEDNTTQKYDRLQTIHGRLAAIYARVSVLQKELEGV